MALLQQLVLVAVAMLAFAGNSLLSLGKPGLATPGFWGSALT